MPLYRKQRTSNIVWSQKMIENQQYSFEEQKQLIFVFNLYQITVALYIVVDGLKLSELLCVIELHRFEAMTKHYIHKISVLNLWLKQNRSLFLLLLSNKQFFLTFIKSYRGEMKKNCDCKHISHVYFPIKPYGIANITSLDDSHILLWLSNLILKTRIKLRKKTCCSGKSVDNIEHKHTIRILQKIEIEVNTGNIQQR